MRILGLYRKFFHGSFSHIPLAILIINHLFNNRDVWIQIEGIINRLDPALEIGYPVCNQRR